jgi:Ser/Thr protein kinase RdoA (MazF antagonist)
VARHNPGRSVAGVERSPSAYATSCPLENVAVVLDDRSSLHLILKDLDPSRLTERARRARPEFLIDPSRETSVYEKILVPRGAGPTVYGLGHGGPDGPWLLLQKAPGVELYQIGELDAWMAAAAWLARFHDSFSSGPPAAAGSLVRHTADFHRLWLERARRFFRDEPPPSRHGRDGLEWIASRFDRVIERLQAWPGTVIHGDFSASNVLAWPGASSWQACPIDWEMAGIGPGILDLAALTSGNWNDDARRRIVGGYVDARGGRAASLDETLEAVDHAHVYLGVQWLGWFGRRRPPAEHRRDWLAESIERAKRLNF